jgi:SAM-dependent methyltransferase
VDPSSPRPSPFAIVLSRSIPWVPNVSAGNQGSGTAPIEVRYWDSLGSEKLFFHPLRIAWLTHYANPSTCILDFGCGYGRILGELHGGGFTNVIGLDFSFRMLQRSRSWIPGVRLVQNEGSTIPLQKHSVDLVLLFAVLTCIPQDDQQLNLVHEISRVLRPGGLLYISDLLLNSDLRNLERYDRYAEEYGTYGVFKLPEGVAMRHHTKEWIGILTGSFHPLQFEAFEATTMNGNKSAAFQYLGRSFPS